MNFMYESRRSKVEYETNLKEEDEIQTFYLVKISYVPCKLKFMLDKNTNNNTYINNNH